VRKRDLAADHRARFGAWADPVGAVLVEVIFGYPGIGALLFQAIRKRSFSHQGIVFTVIVALGLTTFILDVLYPWLDPRISYQRS